MRAFEPPGPPLVDEHDVVLVVDRGIVAGEPGEELCGGVARPTGDREEWVGPWNRGQGRNDRDAKADPAAVRVRSILRHVQRAAQGRGLRRGRDGALDEAGGHRLPGKGIASDGCAGRGQLG